MTIVRLSGGLGNQMFQYACGRGLAVRRGDELVLDTAMIRRQGDPLRQFALAMFNVTGRVEELGPLEPELPGITPWLIQKRRGFHREIFGALPFDSVVLVGNWQSECYFCDVAETIKSDFIFIDQSYRDAIVESLPGLEAGNAVCVHVRRTDYLTPPGDRMGFVGAEFYAQAAHAVASIVPNPHFYIFSDDLEWCRTSLALPYDHSFVDHRAWDNAAERDLWAMTRCHHFIIANSSFSWWAAWLGCRATSVVVAPRRWYRDEVDLSMSRDLVPERWRRL
jgi:hypothetical protein